MIRPVAGLLMASRCVVVMRGGSIPLVVETISSAAVEATLVVPMPTPPDEITPVPVTTPLEVTAPALHTPEVIVPTVAMSMPTSLEAAMLPASMALATAPASIVQTVPDDETVRLPLSPSATAGESACNRWLCIGAGD